MYSALFILVDDPSCSNRYYIAVMIWYKHLKIQLTTKEQLGCTSRLNVSLVYKNM